MRRAIEDIAKDIATEAHKGQFRFDKVTPYIKHPEAVANLLNGQVEKAVAWLHDVLEDTDVTEDDLLKAGIPTLLVHYCHILNKNNYDSYTEYIMNAKKYEVTKNVKIADITHNSSDRPTKRMKRKYEASLAYLHDEIDFETFSEILEQLYRK